jgi:hypothetical protein
LVVTVEEGANLTNELRSRRPVDLVVRVTNESGQPVPNALVTLLLPSTGAGLRAPNGASTVTAQTDDDGRVRFFGLIPWGSGTVTIRVVASFQGVVGRTQITHTNVMGSFMTPTKWGILGAVAAGATALGLGLYYSQREDDPVTRISLGSGAVRAR